MMRLTLVAALLLASPGVTYAAFSTDAGVNGAQFLKIGAGARSLGR